MKNVVIRQVYSSWVTGTKGMTNLKKCLLGSVIGLSGEKMHLKSYLYR